MATAARFSRVTVTDAAPGALPGLDRPAASDFVAAVGEAFPPHFYGQDELLEALAVATAPPPEAASPGPTAPPGAAPAPAPGKD